jgi:hypothetical protein
VLNHKEAETFAPMAYGHPLWSHLAYPHGSQYYHPDNAWVFTSNGKLSYSFDATGMTMQQVVMREKLGHHGYWGRVHVMLGIGGHDGWVGGIKTFEGQAHRGHDWRERVWQIPPRYADGTGMRTITFTVTGIHPPENTARPIIDWIEVRGTH